MTPSPLAVHRRERDVLREGITHLLTDDPRIAASWLFGSLGRGGGDALSDIDLFVAVHDAAFSAVAGTPAVRQAFAARAGSVVLFGEAPQNRPPGGAYLGALYAGTAGPLRVDWYWQPVSLARLPETGAAALLFDRASVARSADAPAAWDFQPMPEETPEETAARDIGAVWSMLLIAAKYLARSPQEDGLPLLGWAYGPLHGLERLLGEPETPPEGVAPADAPPLIDPAAKADILRRLAARMEALTPRLPARGIAAPERIAEQAYRYLDLTESTALHSPLAPSGADRVPS